ncbi:hypothetical protein ENUP19_0297G0025 [Entamoeba nuttalli]|uniref:non-specific serine/threonine protein kinase n=2 Tax=Entamoeba nuttalli TaxID=412467 RepID=K2HYM1_ENTNP|nr:protein kinase domain containing protein [Entamoeba nuttalli P19]EKE41510.1 protein kinase domain containing protein [Entamoeba nuttalli P19]|eukprot:XP_008856155.1 protein kinase domain containing protein [Entamoeba nuttalli P19]
MRHSETPRNAIIIAPFDRSNKTKTATPSVSPDNTLRERVSCDVRRVNQTALNVISITFLKCELQIDISSIFSPGVVGMYFFNVQYDTHTSAIQKRYSQFYFLDNYLHMKYPKIKLPSLPPKEILHSGSHPDVIHKRSKELSNYLENVVKLPNILNDMVVIEWFTQPPDHHLISFSKQKKAGYVFKESSVFKRWKKRYCVLASNVIALFENAKDLLVYEDPIDVYCLKGCNVKPVLDKGPNVMTISRNNLTLCCLYVENDDDFLGWLSSIQDTTLIRSKISEQPIRTKLKITNHSTKPRTRPMSPLTLASTTMKRATETKRFSRIYDNDASNTYKNIITMIYERFRNEMNEIFPYFLVDCKEIKPEHFSFFEELRSLQLNDFLEGKKVEDMFQKLLVISKEYTTSASVQRITWVYINIHKLYKLYCFEGHTAIQQLQEKQTIPRLIPTSAIDSSKLLVCRLCEHQYKLSQFCDHTRLCEVITRGYLKETTCLQRIEMVMNYLRESYQCQMVKDTFKYTQLTELVPNFKTPLSIDKLQKIIEAIRTLCVDVTDIPLLTFARAIGDLLTSYQNLLKEYAESKGSKNLWSFISVLSSKGNKQELLQLSTGTAVSVTDFDIIKKFSAGAYSRIYLVKKKSTGDVYAMKVMKKDDMIRKNVVDSVLVEKNFLSKAHNISVVKLYYAFQDDINLYLVMEYCPGGDLATLLEHIGSFNEYVAHVYSAEILLSLHYIHALGCVHKDIKPDNILINRNGHLVLTDFGLSSYGLVSQETAGKTGIFCTPDYAAPEILISNSYSFASDYFALGCMLYEFVVGYPPFNASTPEAIFMKIQQGVYEWPEDVDVSDDCKDLVSKLLCPEPEKRPVFKQIENHPFFSDIHWDTLFDESREDIFVPQLDGDNDTGYFEDERGMKQSHMKKDDLIGKPFNKDEEKTKRNKKNEVLIKRKESPIPDGGEFGNFDVRNIDNLIEENRKSYAKEFARFEMEDL